MVRNLMRRGESHFHTYPESLQSKRSVRVERKCDPKRESQHIVCYAVEQRTEMLATFELVRPVMKNTYVKWYLVRVEHHHKILQARLQFGKRQQGASLGQRAGQPQCRR